MPCICWYEPSDESKKLIKQHCQIIIDELKRLHEKGDPIGLQISDVKQLLDHLWDPEMCEEKKRYALVIKCNDS